MIQQFEDLHTYEEYPPQEVIEAFVDFVIQNSIHESLMQTLRKLTDLAEKQWHTYAEPNVKLKEKIKNFIISHWINNDDDFLEDVLIIAHSFALDKLFYKTALDNYKGESFKEFEETYLQSHGENIDPYWSMRK